jgi:hypothetical protein
MSNLVRVYVENELAASITIGDNAKNYAGFVEAVSSNCDIINISNLDYLPSIGMKYENNEFLKNGKDLDFITNQKNSNVTIFAFIVDSEVKCVQGFFSPQLDAIIAALQSNPRFEIE